MPFCWRGKELMTSNTLVGNVPREMAGAQTFRAYDYQAHASMARILQAFADGEEFSAFFDIFDDLIFVTEGKDGANISFYQVKTRANSAWTAAKLAHRPAKGLPPKSIIGKSYHNLLQFGDLVRKAAITSNQLLQATHKNGKAASIDDGEILLSALSKADHDKLVAALELDFPGVLDARHAEVLTFQRIPLDMHSFRQTLLGQVTEFLHQLGPEYVVAAKPFYDALLSEISRCTGKVSTAESLVELKAHKGVDRAGLQLLVTRMQTRRSTPMEWWSTFEIEMRAAGKNFKEIQRLKAACLAYWRARERGTAHTLELSQSLIAYIDTSAERLSGDLYPTLTMLLVGWTGAVPSSEAYTLEASLLVELVDAIA